MTVGSGETTPATTQTGSRRSTAPPPARRLHLGRQRQPPARGSGTFEWDFERMVEATMNSVTTTFAYRGDGLRDSRRRA
jgi:hypothetical protein